MNATVDDRLQTGLRRAAAEVGAGRYSVAADIVLESWHDSDRRAPTALRCLEVLVAYRCREAAHRLCREALDGGWQDAELLRLSSQLALEQGDFEPARCFALAAISRLPRDGGLLQLLARTRRSTAADDEDIRRLEAAWQDPAWPRPERVLAGFALGKCYDDIGNYEGAARVWQQANAWEAEAAHWDDPQWRSFVDFTMGLRLPRLPQPMMEGIVPVFIIGLPRTGTSLVADLLGRYPGVRNRGEMNWIWFLWDRLRASGRLTDPLALAEAAALYLRHLRRDDPPARWYIDKNPLNLRSLPLIDALFPNARIILCRRDRRDTVLSIWSQVFATAESDYAYEFQSIVSFADGCDRLAGRAISGARLPVFELNYETLAAAPAAVVSDLAGFLGLPADFDPLAAASSQVTATASVWQVRQPVYRSSVGRWQAYAPFIRPLERLPA